jgi:predicted secreted protein
MVVGEMLSVAAELPAVAFDLSPELIAGVVPDIDVAAGKLGHQGQRGIDVPCGWEVEEDEPLGMPISLHRPSIASADPSTVSYGRAFGRVGRVHESREVVLSERLADARGKQVAFVSHCLLNENVRYLGGAFRPGGVAEVVEELIHRGVGLCQMPCPEQHAWGGVLKRRMLRAYGAQGTLLYRFRGPLLRLFILYTRYVYWRLARRIVRQIADYEQSGFRVIGLVGVGASPSCGVHMTLDIRRSFEVMAQTPPNSVDRKTINRDAVVACRVAGSGLYVRSLKRQLRRRGLTPPLLEHDLVAEMRGQHQQVFPTPPGGPADAPAGG